jgi:hypothetical protein
MTPMDPQDVITRDGYLVEALEALESVERTMSMLLQDYLAALGIAASRIRSRHSRRWNTVLECSGVFAKTFHGLKGIGLRL